MRMWIVVGILLSLPLVAAEEEKKATIAGGVTEVFQLRYARAGDVINALRAFEAYMSFDEDLQILSARGSEDVVEAVGNAIKRIDVPSAATRNIELTFHVLLASRTAGEDGAHSLPESLEPVAVQLKKVLGFTSVRLVESAVIRVRDGNSGSVSGVIGGVGAAPANYRLGFRRAGVAGQSDGIAARLNDLHFAVRIKGNDGELRDVGLETNVDVRSGQKAVVGNAGVNAEGQNIILVVTPSVV